MLQAFQAEFKTIVFAEDLGDAGERLKTWRALSIACGFEPGAGMVKLLPDGGLSHLTAQELEKARAKAAPIATPTAREQAIAGLATHLAGDLSFAGEVVASIEARTGPLTREMAGVLAAASSPSEAAA